MIVLVYSHEVISTESERKPLKNILGEFDWRVNSCVNTKPLIVDAQKLDLYSIFKHGKW